MRRRVSETTEPSLDNNRSCRVGGTWKVLCNFRERHEMSKVQPAGKGIVCEQVWSLEHQTLAH